MPKPRLLWFHPFVPLQVRLWLILMRNGTHGDTFTNSHRTDATGINRMYTVQFLTMWTHNRCDWYQQDVYSPIAHYVIGVQLAPVNALCGHWSLDWRCINYLFNLWLQEMWVALVGYGFGSFRRSITCDGLVVVVVVLCVCVCVFCVFLCVCFL